ncbi:hypothetical protein [Rosenbergiella epipactidis]|uniref:hypothetical protein n=1 Tax=Rosenbergiella epipactidis TaxID=1544694 RepID=UPI001F4ED99D|nr:hypothetical protein [Rosenbergiella epipactidis]
MIKETGGPAFPNVPSDPQYEEWDEGMDLRDYLAAKAMQGDLASQNLEIGIFDNDISDDVLIGRARVYYRMADAMLKARGE